MHISSDFFLTIILFLAALGLCCCARAFSRGAVRASPGGGFSCCAARALGAQASVVAACGLSSGDTAWLSCGTWNLPRPGIKPVSPALPGGFLTLDHRGSLTQFIFITKSLYLLISLTYVTSPHSCPPLATTCLFSAWEAKLYSKYCTLCLQLKKLMVRDRRLLPASRGGMWTQVRLIPNVELFFIRPYHYPPELNIQDHEDI